MKHRRFPVGPLWTNTYLFWDEEGKGFLVDPAGETGQIARFAETQGISVEKILLTHGHLDHAAGLSEALEMFGGKAFVPAGDASLVRSPDSGLRQLMGSEFSGTDDFSAVSDGDRLTAGAMEISVLATPGHTPGSVCYLVTSGSEKVLISGDTLFAGSVGRTDLPGGDPDELDRSIARLAELPDDLPVFPGHGPETDIGTERARNPFWPEEKRRKGR